MAGLNNDEAHFLASVSQATGIDPRVIAAWMFEEGAFKKGGTGGFNYLNLRPTAVDGHTSVSSGGFSQYPDVNAAISATIQVLHQPNMKIILATAQTRPTPQKQITAIAASPWDSGHYGGAGQSLIATITSLFGGQAVLGDKYEGPENAQAVAATVGSGSAADWTSYDAGNAAHDIVSPFENLYSWLIGSWQRVLFVAAGAILVIIALLLIANSMKSNTMTFSRGDE
jgi:hypothetical protein